jgi:hypothetical protein
VKQGLVSDLWANRPNYLLSTCETGPQNSTQNFLSIGQITYILKPNNVMEMVRNIFIFNRSAHLHTESEAWPQKVSKQTSNK